MANPMNALDRIPDKSEIPQYEFLGRKVAAEKFLPKGWGSLVDAKPLRTHVCVVDRCKKRHNPKYVGVLFAGEGDGTEMTRMDKLEETLMAASADLASCKKGWKGFAWQRQQRKGRKNV